MKRTFGKRSRHLIGQLNPENHARKNSGDVSVRKITKKLQKIDVEQNEAKRIKLMSRDEDHSR